MKKTKKDEELEAVTQPDESAAEEVKEVPVAETVKPEEEQTAVQPEQETVTETETETEAQPKQKFANKQNTIVLIGAAVISVAAITTGVLVGTLTGGKSGEGGTGPALKAPAAVIADGKITWSAVENAQSYTVVINEVATVVNGLSYDLSSDNALSLLVIGENEITVKANATGSHSESAISSVTYIHKAAFGAPVNLKVENNILKWDAVAGATSYTVKIGEEAITADKNELDLSAVADKLKTGGNTIAVMANAVGEYHLASAYSASINYSYYITLTKPVLSLDESILSWNAVDNASGYSVRIGAYVTEVKGVEIDLTTLSKLLEFGENEISVKAVGIGGYLDSAYSDSVIYNFSYSSEDAPEAFIIAVDAIKTLTDKMTKAQADAIKKEFDDALMIFNSLTQQQKLEAAVLGAKVKFDAKKNAFDGVMETATTAHRDFSDKLNAMGGVLEKEESLSGLTAAVTAAQSAKDGLSTLAASLISDEQNKILADGTAGLTVWEAAVADAKLAWGIEFGDITGGDAIAEENIVKANALLGGYGALKAYVKAEIGDLKSAAETALTAAQAQIKTSVDGLKAKIVFDGEIAEENITKEYYELLRGYKDEIAALGAYAQTLCDTESLTAAVNGEISKLLSIAVSEKTQRGQSSVICNHQNQNPDNNTYIYVARKYFNVLGETVTVIPELTGEGLKAIEAPTEANEQGWLVWKLTISTPNEVATVSYTIDGEEAVSMTVKIKPNANVWGVTLENGTVTFAGGGDGEKYIDVYESTDVAKSAPEGEVDIIISGAPLAQRIKIESGITTGDLIRQLALAGVRGQHNLTFVFYAYEKDGDADVYSHITSAALLENFDCTVTDEDVKTVILVNNVLDTGVWPEGAGGEFSLIGTSFDAFIAQFNGVENVTLDKDNLEKYFHVKITAFDKDTSEELFSYLAPFKNRGLTYRTFMKEWAIDYFANGGVEKEQLFYLTLSIVPTEKVDGQDNPIFALFRESAKSEVAKGELYTGEHHFKESDTKDKMFFSDAGMTDPDTATANITLGAAYDSIDKWIEAFNKQITDETLTRDTIMKYINWEVEATSNGQTANFKIDFTGASIDGFAIRRNLYEQFKAEGEAEYKMTFKIAPKAGCVYDEYFKASDATPAKTWKGTITEQDVSAPNGAQLRFTGNGFFEFARGDMSNTGNVQNGDVLKGGHVSHIEIKFEKDGVSKSIYLKGDGLTAADKLYAYVDLEDKSTALDCDTVGNGYVAISNFNSWVIEQLGIADFDAQDGWAFSTKLILADGYYYGDSEYSVPVVYQAN